MLPLSELHTREVGTAGGRAHVRRGRAHVGAGFVLSVHGVPVQNLVCSMESRLEVRERPNFSQGLAPKRRSRRGFSGRCAKKTADFPCAISLFGGILVACPSRRQVWAA